MKALFFGSIGTIVETSEIQRQSFNLAFKEAGLNWYWNIATYCDLLRAPGGKKRIRNYSKSVLNENIVDLIHSKKEEYFEKFLSENLSPFLISVLATIDFLTINLFFSSDLVGIFFPFPNISSVCLIPLTIALNCLGFILAL